MNKAEIQQILSDGERSGADIDKGGITTALHFAYIDLQSREPQRSEHLMKLSQAAYGRGLRGTVISFEAGRDAAVGVLVNTDSQLGRGSYSGIYLPTDAETKRDKTGTPVLLNSVEAVLTAYQRSFSTKQPVKDGLIVASESQLEYWQEHGLFTHIERPVDFKGNLTDGDRRNADFIGDNWMMARYLLSLIRVAISLPGDGFTIRDLTREGGLIMSTHEVTAVRFNELINTSHNQNQREVNFARDGNRCQFQGTADTISHENLFTPEELVILYERSLNYRPSDTRSLVGVDLSGVSDLGRRAKKRRHKLMYGDFNIPTCGASLVANYEGGIDFMRAQLGPNEIVGDYHHIIPRGAFFTLLMLVCVENSDMEKWINNASVEQVIVWARGIKISDVMQKMRKINKIDKKKIAEVSVNNIVRWDQIVNSPYNTISLCRKCHRRAIHPDMRYIREICGFILAVEAHDREIKLHPGDVSLDSDEISTKEQDLIEQILSGGFTRYVKDVPYSELMDLMHACRTAVMILGTNYWAPGYADKLLDRARFLTRGFLSRLDRQDWQSLVDTGVLSSSDPKARMEAAKGYSLIKDQGRLTKYNPKRRLGKLDLVKDFWQVHPVEPAKVKGWTDGLYPETPFTRLPKEYYQSKKK